MSNELEQQKNESGKVLKAYQRNVKQITALLGGDKPLFGNDKIPQDEVGGLVAEMMKDRKKKTGEEVKAELGALLDAHVAMKREIRKKEQELKQLEEKKMKEFNDQAKKVLGKVDGLNQIEKEYYQALGGAIQESPEQTNTKSEEEED
jgi:hypothetical protein